MSDRLARVAAGAGGTEVTRFNALRHGLLSRYTVLPWEDVGEYEALLAALAAEHRPQGPTEEHLVEELAGILWRKRRLRLAEAAAHRCGLDAALSPYGDVVKCALVHLDSGAPIERAVDAVRARDRDTEAELADMGADEAITRRALAVLQSGQSDAYQRAVGALRDDTREWWADMLTRRRDELDEGEKPATRDADGLRRFIEEHVLPWFETRRKELANRHLIREQAFGESLDPDRLERLARYEVHLDRKLERTLAMLMRLKELRQDAAES